MRMDRIATAAPEVEKVTGLSVAIRGVRKDRHQILIYLMKNGLCILASPMSKFGSIEKCRIANLAWNL